MTWPTARLIDVTSKIGSGATPRGGKDNYLTNGEIVLIRSQNVHNDGFKRDGLAFISQEQADDLSNVIVEAGDTLLNITGDSVARVCLAPLGYNARVNQHVAIIRPNPEILDNRFLRYHMVSPAMQQYMLGYAASGATRNALTKGMIENFEVPLPPLPEQKAIANVLGTLDDKIDLNRRMNETLEEMARAIFKDWFVDFGPTRAKIEGRAPYLAPDLWALFPDRLGDDGLPVGWEMGTLSDYTDLQNGYAFKSTDWQEEGVPVVKIGSVKPAVVDLEQVSFVSPELAKERANFRLVAGDILVGLTGYVGETGRIPPTDNLPMLNQRVARFVPDSDCYGFVYACVRDSDFKAYAENKGHGSAQANVSTRDLLTYPVVKAPDNIVRSYGDMVEPFLAKGLSNLGEMAELSKSRDMLLPKLMTGEVRVNGEVSV